MRHQDFVDVGMATSVPGFRAGLVRFAERMDFGHISAVLVLDQGPNEPIFLSVGNTPKEYLDTYQSPELGKRDPVLKKLKRLSVPFIYDQQLYVDAGAGELWENQARFGFKTGVAVGLHLPQERHFLLGVDRPQPLPQDDPKITQLLATLQLLAVHAQDAAQRLMTARPTADSQIRLTPRETEVLRMTMNGLTVPQISDRVNLSERAVLFHLANVRTKFNTTSKHQAVLRALALGLL
jgi:DNA-binding CsgD family transcriptional regulator